MQVVRSQSSSRGKQQNSSLLLTDGFVEQLRLCLQWIRNHLTREKNRFVVFYFHSSMSLDSRLRLFCNRSRKQGTEGHNAHLE